MLCISASEFFGLNTSCLNVHIVTVDKKNYNFIDFNLLIMHDFTFISYMYI